MMYEDEEDEPIRAPASPPPLTDWGALGIKPPPLRPLRYCDMRIEDGMCLRYASLELDTMAFCTYHHQEVSMALAEEERRIS